MAESPTGKRQADAMEIADAMENISENLAFLRGVLREDIEEALRKLKRRHQGRGEVLTYIIACMTTCGIVGGDHED